MQSMTTIANRALGLAYISQPKVKPNQNGNKKIFGHLPPKQEPFDVNSRHFVWKEPSSHGLLRFTEITVHWPGSIGSTGTIGRFSFDVLFI